MAFGIQGATVTGSGSVLEAQEVASQIRREDLNSVIELDKQAGLRLKQATQIAKGTQQTAAPQGEIGQFGMTDQDLRDARQLMT